MSSASNPFIESVQSEVARYLGRFPVEAALLQPLSAQLAQGRDDILLRSTMQGHITTSSLVLNTAGTKALVIWHRLFNRWLQPGGHYEEPGNLWASAQREVEEETGTFAELHRWCAIRCIPLDIDTHPIAQQPLRDEGPHFHHDFVYLSVAEEADLVPQLAEVHAAAWVPLAELRSLDTVRMNRMLDKLEGIFGRKIEAAAFTTPTPAAATLAAALGAGN